MQYKRRVICYDGRYIWESKNPQLKILAEYDFNKDFKIINAHKLLFNDKCIIR